MPGVGIQFNAAGSVGVQLSYVWKFGDGTVGSGFSPVKAYAAPGTYTVALTVRDAYGFQSTQYTNAFIGGVAPVYNLNTAGDCINTPDGFRVCNGVVVPGAVGTVVVGSTRVVTPVYTTYGQLGSVGPCTIYGGSCVVAVNQFGVASTFTRPVSTYPFGCATMILNGVTVCR